MTTRTEQTFRPPVMEAASWIEGKDFSDLPLINCLLYTSPSPRDS